MGTLTVSAIIGAIIGALSGNLGAALLGAGVGAGISAWVMTRHENKKERKNRALDLIQEYTSPDFIIIRNDAGIALREAFKNVTEPSWDNLYHELGQSEWQKISKIDHYFRKVEFLLRIKEADSKYIAEYFRAEYPHWQEKYFNKINSASKKADVEFDNLHKICTE
jgi:hypothetical protein